MKDRWKSAIFKSLLGAACLASLGACDSINNIEWPHVYGPNEVPQSVIDAPRAVAVPPPLPPDTTFPRLGDVPSNPKNFTPPPQIDAAKQRMEDDRAEAGVLRQQAETPTIVPPAVVLPDQAQ